MKLSIIIPVYRTQATLKRCMDSILRQSFTDYEIILVDDGSPDQCPQRCDDYAKQDSRIKVIHKTNGGLSDARNAGLEMAQGEYITFVDSDDAIAPNTLQQLIEELALSSIDILEYPVLERLGHPTREHLLTFEPKIYDDALEYWLDTNAYTHTYAWNKLYKRNLFQTIKFPKGKNFEDAQTTPYLIGLIPSETATPKPRIKVTNVGQYLYYWNDEGITASAKYEDYLNLYVSQTLALIYVCKRIKGRENEWIPKYHAALEDFMTKILNVLLDLYELSDRYETHPPLINRLAWMKQYTSISSLKLRLLSLIGYKRLCRINKLMHKIYKHH